MKIQSRPNGAWETSRKSGLLRRLTLRRADGQVYLDRWGISHDRIGDVLLHRMAAPDPGIDLHDHPWTFVSIVLWGGYTELRCNIRDAPSIARIAEEWPDTCRRGVDVERRVGSVRRMRLDECHTITKLHGRRCWTLVIKGPRRRSWASTYPPATCPRPSTTPPSAPSAVTYGATSAKQHARGDRRRSRGTHA